MICFNGFFPWIGHTAEIPQPVSNRVVEAINHPTFHRHKVEIEVVNVGGEPPDQAEAEPVRPGDTVISLGGGVDSSALHVLFPEATLVNGLLALLVGALLVAVDRGHRAIPVGSNLPTMLMKVGVRSRRGARPAVRALETFTVPIVQASGVS